VHESLWRTIDSGAQKVIVFAEQGLDGNAATLNQRDKDLISVAKAKRVPVTIDTAPTPKHTQSDRAAVISASTPNAKITPEHQAPPITPPPVIAPTAGRSLSR
jgi:hypothetical protein